MAQHSSSSQSDLSLSRNSSLSRLNAQAPEFVPTRPSTRSDLQPLPPPPKQSPRILIPSPPPPPPPAMMHGYPPPPPGSPFHVPIQTTPVPVPTHVVSIQNHPYHPHHRHHHHSHHVPVLYHPHNPQYYADNGGFHDPDTPVVQPAQKPLVESDYAAPSRSKLTDEVSQKLLNQAHIELAASRGYLKKASELAGNFVLVSLFLLY